MSDSDKSNPMAQHYVECEFCESRPAQHFCNTCPGSMCDLCKDEHQRKKVFQHHKITLLALSRDENPLCRDHDVRCCELYCKPCQKPVCYECITEKHKGHIVDKLSEFLDYKRNLYEQIQSIDKSLIPAYENVLSETKTRVFGMVQRASELSTAVQKQTENIIHDVRSAESEYLSSIEKNTNEAISSMKADESTVADRINRLQGVKGALQNLYDSNRYDKDLLKKEISKMEEMKTLPDITSCIESNFVPGQVDAITIDKQMGDLTFSAISKTHGSVVFPSSASTVFVRDNKKVILPIRKALLSTDLKQQVDILCIGEDSIVIVGNDKNVRIVDKSGKIKKIAMELPNDPMPKGISLTSDRRIIYTQKSDKNVMSLSMTGDVLTMFTLKRACYPVGPFVTKEGYIFLCLLYKFDTNEKDQSGNVVKFTALGDALLDINDCNGETIFKRPTRVIENQVNADIIVSDVTANVVLVFDSPGKQKFKYNGNLLNSATFEPICIAADLVGNIIIADSSNNALHILNKEGDPLTLLLAGELEMPMGVCFDGFDSIWVTEFVTGIVKMYQYLE